MAISLINHVAAGSTDGNAVTTGAIDTTGASLLVLVVSNYELNGQNTITDSNGNTWTPLTAYASSDLGRVRIYYAKNPTVGAGHTFTAASLTSSFPAIAAAAFGTTDTTAPFDSGTDSGATGTGLLSITPGSVTPSADNEVVVTGLSLGSAQAGSLQTPNGYTRTDWIERDSNHIGVALAYKVQTTAAATNPSWSWTTTTTAAVDVAAFKAVSAPAVSALIIPGGGCS